MIDDLSATGITGIQKVADLLADFGRGGDAHIVHATEGEAIVPLPVLDENPRLKEALFTQMREMGLEPERYIVGNELNSINPITGQPEFGIKSFFRGAKNVLKAIAPIVLPIVLAGTRLGPILGSTAGIGIARLLQGKGLGRIGKDMLYTAGITTLMSGLAGRDVFLSDLNIRARGGDFLRGNFFEQDPAQTLIGERFAQQRQDEISADPVGPRATTFGLDEQQAGTDLQRTLSSRDTRSGFGIEGQYSPHDNLQRRYSKPFPFALDDSEKQSIARLDPNTKGFGESIYEALTPGGMGFGAGLKQAFLPESLSLDAILAQKGLTINTATAADIDLAEKLMKLTSPGDLRKYLPLTALGLGAAGLFGAFDDPDEPEPIPVSELERQLGPTAGDLVAATPTRYRTGIPTYSPVSLSSVSVPTAYGADGGSVGFPRRIGAIAGGGTGTSDNVPAMLSDGEYVMTAKAVRGAGNGNRKQGMRNMYDMMRQFEGQVA